MKSIIDVVCRLPSPPVNRAERTRACRYHRRAPAVRRYGAARLGTPRCHGPSLASSTGLQETVVMKRSTSECMSKSITKAQGQVKPSSAPRPPSGPSTQRRKEAIPTYVVGKQSRPALTTPRRYPRIIEKPGYLTAFHSNHQEGDSNHEETIDIPAGPGADPRAGSLWVRDHAAARGDGAGGIDGSARD